MKKIALAAAVTITLAVAAFVSMPRAASRTYIFSTTPWGTGTEMKAMYKPLLDYISEQTGAKFKMVTYPDYDTLVKQIEGGYVDFAQINQVSYVRLVHDGAGVRYLVTSMRAYDDGTERDNYLGYVFTLKKSKIKTFDDLKGKVFGFVDVTSASGYKMVRAYMAQKGLDPKIYFRKYFFLGDHDEVAKAVKNGMVDAGATWEVSYKLNVSRFGNIFRIVYTTPAIPNDAWIVSNSVPRALADDIKKALMGATVITTTKDGRMVLNRKAGMPEVSFTERSNEFYMKAADLLLYEDKGVE
jgi:phosphate/phosphite/phosphonate ABC transporter binding protein